MNEFADSSWQVSVQEDNNNDALVGSEDVPIPTENGGYTHTAASKAKISAANKGKTPWNKGKSRSEEVKQRIAEGVRRKNREKFLKKLNEMGLTEEEYEQQMKEERRRKDAERRARMTANGGYTPTEETKQKISQVLKEKHAKGEIKKRVYTGPFRKGFTHSEETKEKIRNSLRKKWAEDPEYQAKMKKTAQKKANSLSAREKISQTLKQKWQDPEFRMKMVLSMKGRKSPSLESSKAQREKISAAMKRKWQDVTYRRKAILGMERYRESLPTKPVTKARTRKRTERMLDGKIVPVSPLKEGKQQQIARPIQSKVKVKSTSDSGVVKTVKKKKTVKRKKSPGIAKVKTEVMSNVKNVPDLVKKSDVHEFDGDGDISRMKEERRDLYDLLYGDEYDDVIHDASDDVELSSNKYGKFTASDVDLSFSREEDEDYQMSDIGAEVTGLSPFFTSTVHLDDDNLDDFDPYNLDDY